MAKPHARRAGAVLATYVNSYRATQRPRRADHLEWGRDNRTYGHPAWPLSGPFPLAARRERLAGWTATLPRIAAVSWPAAYLGNEWKQKDPKARI